MDCYGVLVYPLFMERTLESERKPPALWILNHRGSSCWYWILVTFRAFVCAVSKWREIRSGSARPKGGLLLESIKEMCDHICVSNQTIMCLISTMTSILWRQSFGGKKVQPSAVLKENCSSTPSRVSRLCVMRNKILLVKTAVAALYYTTAQYSKLKIHGARTGQNTADDSIGNKGAVAIRCIVVYLVQLAK